SLADPGVDEDDPIPVTDGEGEHQPILSGERVRRRIGDVRQMERDHVVRRHRRFIVPLSLQNGPSHRSAGISRGAQTLRSTGMGSPRRASALNVWLALGTVYLVWGSTHLAIAIAVQTLPPLFYSGVRFGSAGLILTAWLAFRGVDLP